MTKVQTLRERYEILDNARSAVMTRAWEHAQLTIPRNFKDKPFQGTQSTTAIRKTHSNYPATIIKKLASIFTTSLYPTNDSPFFELKVGPKVTEEQRTALADFLVQAEIRVLDAIQSSNFREKLYTSLEHAIMMPGSLVYQEEIDLFKGYHPAQFLIRRDGNGIIKEYWTVDWVVTELLDDELANINARRPKHQRGEHEPLYTYCRLEDDKWTVDREFRDEKYETNKTFDTLPYYFLGWTPVVGEDWPRSLVEDNIGTIENLELAEKALVEGMVAGSSGRVNLDSHSSATIADINKTKNWSLISIPKGSMEFLQPNVSAALSVTFSAIQNYKEQLDAAFLTFSPADLTGERVTAFQTNAVANEAQQARGGVLVTMEQNLEAMVRRTIGLLADAGDLNPLLKTALDDGDITITVASGLDAIGRQMDVLRLDALLERIAVDPEMRSQIKMPEVSRSYVRSMGLDPTIYTKTEEELAAEQQAAQQQQLQQQGAEQAIQSAGAIAEGNLTP